VSIGIAALIYSLLVLPKDNPSPSESFDFTGMLLLSPGLALLLFGVSSIPTVGTVLSARVLLPVVVGIALIVAFVRHAFRPEYPLIDLRLFKDRQLTLSVIGMFLFAMSFFGAALLLPSYFQQVRLQDTLHSGLLVAPQGIGAMITMPIAGFLADRMAIKKIVIPGLIIICIGMAELTQFGAHTSYVLGARCAVRHGPGRGRDDHAAVHRGAADAHWADDRPRLHAHEHHAADRQLLRCGDHDGDLDQSDQDGYDHG